MTALTDQDRIHLRFACELAAGARQPPKKLGQRVEPLWAAVLALGENVLASAVYHPGDTSDAVKRLDVDVPAEAVLYLTLEPKADFDRLPPVTESIRTAGIQKVVIGTLSPSIRSQGEGVATLARLGIEIVLADGEEARLAQQLLDDYRLWLTRGLAVLHAKAELRDSPEGGLMLQLGSSSGQLVAGSDAVLFMAGEEADTGAAWKVVLDPQGWERPAPGKILYQPAESAVAGARVLPLRGDELDLGQLLRDLGSLGILTVEIGGNAALFRQALGSGLVESVRASFAAVESGVVALSHLEKVALDDGGQPASVKLGGARLLEQQNHCLEARIQLC